MGCSDLKLYAIVGAISIAILLLEAALGTAGRKNILPFASTFGAIVFLFFILFTFIVKRTLKRGEENGKIGN